MKINNFSSVFFVLFFLSFFNLKAEESSEGEIYLESHNFDYDSVREICGESNQAMIYGWSDCYYQDITTLLQEPESPILKTYNHKVGSLKWPKWKNREEEYKNSFFTRKTYNEIRREKNDTLNDLLTTLEGWKIEQIPLISKEADKSRECKMGLTNMILENYKRKIRGVPLIIILFVVDRDENPYTDDIQWIASRESPFNGYITNKELRRAYKLCMELEGDLKSLEEVAQQSIIFVKLTKTSPDKYGLVVIEPFWQKEAWNYFWMERLSNKKKEGREPNFSWREKLEKALRKFEKTSK